MLSLEATQPPYQLAALRQFYFENEWNESSRAIDSLPDDNASLPTSYTKIYIKTLQRGASYTYTFAVIYANGFICSYIVKEISLATFASAILITTQFNTVIDIFMAPLYMVSQHVAKDYKGESSPEEISRTVQSGWVLGSILSIPVIAIFSASQQIFIAFGQNPVFATMAQPFFWPILPAVPMIFFSAANAQFLNGINKRWLLYTAGTCFLGVSAGATYIFARGAGAIPPLGLQGYGIGQLIALFVQASILGIGIGIHKDFKIYKFYQLHKPYKERFLRVMTQGLPLLLAVAGDIGVMYVLPIYAGVIGNTQLIAQGVLSNYNYLIYPIIFAFMSSTINLVSQANGSKKWQDVKRCIIANMTCSAGVLSIYLILTAAIPIPMASIFISDQTLTLNNTVSLNSTLQNATAISNEIFSAIIPAFPLSALATLIDSVRWVMYGALLGVEDITIPSFFSLGSQIFLTLPLAYALGVHTPLEVTGLQLANIIVLSLISAFFFVRLFLTKTYLKKTITVDEETMTELSHLPEASSTSSLASPNRDPHTLEAHPAPRVEILPEEESQAFTNSENISTREQNRADTTKKETTNVTGGFFAKMYSKFSSIGIFKQEEKSAHSEIRIKESREVQNSSLQIKSS